jgi:hypothetical protein
MAIRGKVFLVPNEKQRTYELLVVNEGDREIGVTHNVLRKGEENLAVHDDHVRYGHGLPVRPNDGGMLSFHYGDSYNNRVPIQEGSVLRLGLRGAAFTTVELPPLDGEMIELDFKDFQWYGSEQSHDTSNMRHYAAQARNPLQLDVGKDKVRARVEQLLAAKRKGPPCHGSASVTAVPGKGGALSHWEVRFKNTGDTPWIGTCVFEGAQKNSGLGLESMACPDKGSAAMQRIEANGNYGVIAQAGRELRLGVRGYGTCNIQLPSQGTVEVDLKRFKIQSIEIENRLPAKDTKVDGTPEIGFVATMRLGDAGGQIGWDPGQLPPKKFETPGERKSWFLPAGANINGVSADAGEKLIVGTRGLGWYCVVELPAKGTVDTDKKFDLWAFREDQFARQNLLRDFTSRCRN